MWRLAVKEENTRNSCLSAREDLCAQPIMIVGQELNRIITPISRSVVEIKLQTFPVRIIVQIKLENMF